MAILTTLAIAVSACNAGTTGSAPTAPQADLSAKVTQMQVQIDSLRSQLESMQKTQLQADRQLFTLSMTANADKSATFDPVTDQGYQRLDLGVAKVMVSISDIRPYADGVKVTLMIGNPNAVTFDGVDGSATYGPSLSSSPGSAASVAAVESAMAKQKTIKLSLPDSLLPGRWNRVTLNLPGVKADDFGHLELSLSGNKVRLFGR
jgi:hypothetical protein